MQCEVLGAAPQGPLALIQAALLIVVALKHSVWLLECVARPTLPNKGNELKKHPACPGTDHRSGGPFLDKPDVLDKHRNSDEGTSGKESCKATPSEPPAPTLGAGGSEGVPGGSEGVPLEDSGRWLRGRLLRKVSLFEGWKRLLAAGEVLSVPEVAEKMQSMTFVAEIFENERNLYGVRLESWLETYLLAKLQITREEYTKFCAEYEPEVLPPGEARGNHPPMGQDFAGETGDVAVVLRDGLEVGVVAMSV